MSIVACTYFDGRRSVGQPASLIIGRGGLRVVGAEVSLLVEARRVRLSSRIAHTPRWVYLPDGGACMVADNAAIDPIAKRSPLERRLLQWESRPALAAVALLLVATLVAVLVKFGVPLAADQVAQRIPPEVEVRLGRQALEGLDRQVMRPSKLAPARQARLRSRLETLVAADGGTPVQLEFRDAPRVGPNAFALPGNLMVATDQLVQLAKHDDEVVGVLAHELGHLRLRHAMRGLLEGSAAALIVAAITGDIASTSTLAASAPVLLLQSKFSRDNETEADDFALALLGRAGIDSAYLADLLARLRGNARGALPGFLSTHPASDDREAKARAASNGARAKARERGDPGTTASATSLAADPPNNRAVDPALIRDPRQQRLVRLVLAGDVDALEAEAGALQSAFEADPAGADALITAFHAFSKLPPTALATLDRWMQRHPASHVAAVARARFHYDRGWAARGTAIAADTPRDNVDHMNRFFALARGDARAALTLSRKPLLAHRYLMLIAVAQGSRGDVETHRLAGESLAPSSIETRLISLHALERRWGGSFERMQGYVAEAKARVSPADARRLAAALESERARNASDRAGELAHLDAALALDRRADLHCRRADALQALKRAPEAYEAVRAGLALEPEEDRCLSEAVEAADGAPSPQAALDLLAPVFDYGRADEHAYARRGWRHQQLGRFDAALADYRFAAERDHVWSQMRLAEMLYHGQGTAPDRAAATRWVERAAALGDPQALRMIRKPVSAGAGRPPVSRP